MIISILGVIAIWIVAAVVKLWLSCFMLTEDDVHVLARLSALHDDEVKDLRAEIERLRNDR